MQGCFTPTPKFGIVYSSAENPSVSVESCVAEDVLSRGFSVDTPS